MPPIAVDDAAPADTGEHRVVEAALTCLARWGVAKTTLDDIARQAGISRATAYRLFPGGKETVLDAVVADELARFAAGLTERLAEVDDVEELLVTGLVHAARELRDHEALRYLLEHEPEQVLPHVSFGRFDTFLAGASHLVAPHLERFMEPEVALRTGEWVTRLLFSYTMAPSPSYDFTEAGSVRSFVRTFVLPGLVPRTTPTP